jgi:hypothetical protein
MSDFFLKNEHFYFMCRMYIETLIQYISRS